MDRLAIGFILTGLVLIIGLVASVLGMPAGQGVPTIAALGAAIAGFSIVGGLVMLERRTKLPFARSAA